MPAEIRPLDLRASSEHLDVLLELYAAVGWSNYTANPTMLCTAWEHSLAAWGAFVEGRLVGIARVVGDGASVVLLQDVLVHPAYQRSGIGTALMRTVMQQYTDVYQFELLTDNAPNTRAFYGSLGLAPAASLGCVSYVRMHVQEESTD